MKKSGLLDKVSEETNFSKADVDKIISSFVTNLLQFIKDGHKISISNLGSFEKSERSERVGINPKTKEKIQIPAKNVPKFKAAKAFKDGLN